MPRGRGAVERRQLAHRARKNEETMVDQYRRRIAALFGDDGDDPYFEMVQDETSDAMRHRLCKFVEEDVAGPLLQATVTDPPLMTAICLELDTELQTTEPLSVESVSFSMAECCLEPCNYLSPACVWHQQGMHDARSVYIETASLTATPAPLTHQSHPAGTTCISGEVYRGCVTTQCERFECVCDGDRHLLHRDYKRRDNERLLRDYSEIDHRVHERYSNVDLTQDDRLGLGHKPTVCRCVDLCAYSRDLKRSVKRLRKEIRNLDYDLAKHIRTTNHPDVCENIERYLTCRQKFLLSMKDGIPRRGCNKQRYTSSEDSGPSSSNRCICSTRLFKDPSLWLYERRFLRYICKDPLSWHRAVYARLYC